MSLLLDKHAGKRRLALRLKLIYKFSNTSNIHDFVSTVLDLDSAVGFGGGGGGGEGVVEVKTACQLRPSCAKRHFSLFSCDRGAVVASRERFAGGAADLRLRVHAHDRVRVHCTVHSAVDN